MMMSMLTKTQRKRLGSLTYKKRGVTKEHKKPGAISLEVKQKLLKEGTFAANEQIKRLEREGGRIFGTWSQYG